MRLFRKYSEKKHRKKKPDFISGEDLSDRIPSDMKLSAKPNSKTGRIGYLRENCDQIAECRRQIEEARIEYQAVTSYLTDMQKIDLIPKEQRLTLEDAARKIINLSKDREKFQSMNTSITDIQYRLFERYEAQIPKELSNIKESENYQGLIQKDMDQLDKEKQNLIDEEAELSGRQSFLRGIAVTTCIIVILLFAIFAVLVNYTESNLSLPFLLTVLMGMASALYIFMEARKNTHDIKLVGLKMHRQVALMNKVKIKSVGNRNYLEYTYSKYMVDNYDQLRLRWEEYVRVKDETRRYQSNTELLEFYNTEMIGELKKAGIVDSEIWIYQPTAILDSKEMVEVRHRLNVRRQKLRERIDACNKQMEETFQTIREIRKAYADIEEESVHLLKRYHIEP